MWYFQISNDLGTIIYSIGNGAISLNSKPMILAQTMLHTMNVAVKHSFNHESLGISDKVISAQKVYKYKEDYIKGSF